MNIVIGEFMKKLIGIAVFSLLFILVSCGAGSDINKETENGKIENENKEKTQSTKIVLSGRIEHGLRVIDVENGTENLKITVYRGDYIIFRFKDKMVRRISIPQLEINSSFPPSEGEKPYIKMKNSGSFAFTLGNFKGSIEVLEYTGQNYQEVSAEEASLLIANTSPLILDVRTQQEYEYSRIEGALLYPVQTLEQDVNKLLQYKNEPVFVYCQSGNRSTVASRMLINAGFTKVYNLRNGIGDWVNRGFVVD